VQLHYAARSVLALLAFTIVGLALLWIALQGAGLQHAWPVLAALWLLTALWNVCWLLWLSTIEFDRRRDRVRRGPWTVGRLSALWAIERAPGPDSGPLRLLFLDRSGEVRPWALPRIGPAHANALGLELAMVLGVNFG
jgi:hypothetical protein